jgi:DNA repair exonuclease SbcCD ATPase subunit
MRLILVKFNNVLGLNGSINFVENKPLFLYGENIAGKSNIINMLRYCLIPKMKEKRGYSEEKRLEKDEILLQENSSGTVEIYFEQNAKLYKLYYFFSRGKRNVSQVQRLFESELSPLPIDDLDRTNVLEKLNWKDLGITSSKALKEKLLELQVFPEILDILISPSNVRNFSEAINGSVVRIPEIIAKRISNIHTNVEKYLNNLQKLHEKIVVEESELEKKIKELENQFKEISKNLPEIKMEEIFIISKITKNLENLQAFLTKKLESIPREVSEIKEISGLFASDKYDMWAKAIDNLMASINRKEEIKGFIKKETMFKEVEDTLNEWSITFQQLPSEENLEALSSFMLPKCEKFDFSILSRPEQVRLIFSKLSEAKSLLKSVTEICREFRISLKVSDINNLITSYKKLSKAIKSPLEPMGDPALISKQKDKIVVSIPLDVALKKMDYLKGIEPIPLIHRPEKLKKEEFQKEISKLQDEINKTLQGLRKAKESLSSIKKLLREVKTLRESLIREIETIKASHEKIKKELDKLIKDVENSYYHLCEMFELKPEGLDFSNEKTLETSFNTILKSCNEAQRLFYEDLSKNLEKYPELLQKLRITEKGELKEVVEKIRKELQKKVEEVSRLQEEYRKLNEWILTNSSHVKLIEDKIRTIKILTIALFLAQEILTRIHQKTNVKRIIEELAEKIEESVKETYSKIFPEDESFIFEHIGEGKFLSTINNKPITHPSGSQRVAISLGIMLSLAETFRLPIILDEAFDRLDVNRLKFFCEYITTLSRRFQLCLVGYTSYNIEKNLSVLSFINNWKVYQIERTKTLEKNIKPVQTLTVSE